jgi:hypothetical protein
VGKNQQRRGFIELLEQVLQQHLHTGKLRKLKSNYRNSYNTNSALFWELYGPPKLSLTGHCMALQNQPNRPLYGPAVLATYGCCMAALVHPSGPLNSPKISAVAAAV